MLLNAILFAFCFGFGASTAIQVDELSQKPEGQVDVAVTLHLISATFDEKTRILSGMVWLNMMWKDERLASKTSNATLRVPTSKIWSPDVTFFHSPFVAESAEAIVTADGTVTWAPKVMYSEPCVTSAVRFFPEDSYVCRLAVGSWTFGESELKISIEENPTYILEPLQQNAAWNVSVKEIKLYRKKYPGYDKEHWPKALYDFELRRKSSSLGLILIFPAIMTALMTVSMFILPAECREKVTFGGIIFLTLVLIIKDLPSVLPTGGVTAICCYYAVNLAFVSVTLFIHCCLVLVSYPANSSVRPHRILRKLVSGFSAISCFANEHLELDESDEDDPDMSNSAKGARNIAEWRFVARMIDRFLLVLFSFLLILIGVMSTTMVDEERIIPNL